MTVISLAVVWCIVGLVVAAMFGAAVWRTNRLREDEEVPQRTGADIQYMRHTKRTGCQISRTALNLPKKQSARRRAVA